MRIGIDARFFGTIGKGLGRYTQKLIENLEKIDRQNEYLIFMKAENFNEYEPKNPKFKKILADFHWYKWQEQIKFPRLLSKYRLDLMHFPHFNVPLLYRGKFIVTIHDLILLHFPTVRSSTLHPFWYKIKFFVYKLVIKSAINRSARIIAVSKFTKRDILENYQQIPCEKILVTYEACEDYCMLSPNRDNEILSKYGIMKPYLMYVGNAYPHKNLERLVLAFKNVIKYHKNLKLVLVGKSDYFYERLRNFTKDNAIGNVIFTDQVPDYELDTLFHNVAAYIWPSLYEGFGLSPLEAMAKGAVVLSSDHQCMREILGDSVCYFNGKEIRSIEEAINQAFENPEMMETMRKNGYLQIRKYSWKSMAQKTLDLYENIPSR